MDKRYDAVLFDLFGTLVENITDAFYHASLRRTAEALGVDGGAFLACWIDDDFRRQRRCGILPSPAAQMAYACARLGVTATPAMIERAAALQRQDFGSGSRHPRPGTLETLARLRAAGYRLGLISDCSWEVPEVRAQSAFAGIFHTTIFSCVAGAKKPDPRLYRLACEGLGVPPARCLYIGDGDGRELTGARQAGMEAVLLCAPHEREIVMRREDPRQWDGPVIESIDAALGSFAMPAHLGGSI